MRTCGPVCCNSWKICHLSSTWCIWAFFYPPLLQSCSLASVHDKVGIYLLFTINFITQHFFYTKQWVVKSNIQRKQRFMFNSQIEITIEKTFQFTTVNRNIQPIYELTIFGLRAFHFYIRKSSFKYKTWFKQFRLTHYKWKLSVRKMWAGLYKTDRPN